MQTLPMLKRSLLDVILGRQIKANAIVELHNAIASGELSTTHTSLIEQKYEVDLGKSLLRERRSIFRDLVRSLVADQEVCDADVRRMKDALVCLRLSKGDADAVFHEEIGRLYARKTRERIVHSNSDKRDGELGDFKRRLHIPPQIAARIESESAVEAVIGLIDDLIADGFASNEDMKRIGHLCNRLEINRSDIPSDALERLNEARMMRNHLVEPLRPIEVHYNLRKGEQAYVQARSAWYETRVRGSGANRQVRYEMITGGDLVITNKRIMVIPGRGSPKALNWSSVLDVAKLSDSEIELVKDRGKTPVIQVEAAMKPELPKAIPIIAERCCHGTESSHWRNGSYY